MARTRTAKKAEIRKHKVLNKRTEAEIMANIGIETELKSLGKVEVKEPSLESIIRYSTDVAKLFENFQDQFGKDKTSDAKWLLATLQNKDLLKTLKIIAGACTEREATDFDNLGLSDWLKLVRAFKKAINWEEMREVFFEIVPQETWRQTMGR